MLEKEINDALDRINVKLDKIKANSKDLSQRYCLAMEALMKVEWIYEDGPRGMKIVICAWCKGNKHDGGHKPDCLRQRALGLDKKEGEE